MNPAQRNRTLALVRAGFEDGPALTVASTDGEIPQGRELSFAWLTGTVMTGLTSVMLMGAALYVSFQGQDTFSTAYEALQIVTSDHESATDLISKTNRVRPTTVAKSELEIVEASIRETVDGRDLIKKQPFVRIRATLATAATALSEDIPAYDPQAMENARKVLPEVALREDAYDVCEGADALVILTEWNQFRMLDLARVKSLLRQPLIADLRNVYDPVAMRDAGFTYVCIGR